MKIDPNDAQLLPDDVIGPHVRQQITKTNNHNPAVQAKGIFIEVRAI